MDQFVVTVGRQFGSMGKPIAKRVAELLGIDCYDRDIVEEAAKRLGMPVQVVSKAEEDARKSFGIFGKALFPLGTGTSELQDKIFSAQASVLRDFASRGPCILVGRCSDFVMKAHPNAMHVFVYAPLDERIKTCVEVLNMTPEDGRKMCLDVDKSRYGYHMRFAGFSPTDPEHKDLMLNSAMLGVEGSAGFLADLIKKRFSLG